MKSPIIRQRHCWNAESHGPILRESSANVTLITDREGVGLGRCTYFLTMVHRNVFRPVSRSVTCERQRVHLDVFETELQKTKHTKRSGYLIIFKYLKRSFTDDRCRKGNCSNRTFVFLRKCRYRRTSTSDTFPSGGALGTTSEFQKAHRSSTRILCSPISSDAYTTIQVMEPRGRNKPDLSSRR